MRHARAVMDECLVNATRRRAAFNPESQPRLWPWEEFFEFLPPLFACRHVVDRDGLTVLERGRRRSRAGRPSCQGGLAQQ